MASRKEPDGYCGSIEKVANELYAGGDELSDWARAANTGFFLAADDAVVPVLSEVSEWSHAQSYQPAAIASFLQGADYWLVAQAKAHRCTVVTHEAYSDTVKKIKIPNVCLGMGVSFMTPWQMLRAERASFVLGMAA